MPLRPIPPHSTTTTGSLIYGVGNDADRDIARIGATLNQLLDGVPRIVRHSLNLESGMNDGLALPAVIAFSTALTIGFSHGEIVSERASLTATLATWDSGTIEP